MPLFRLTFWLQSFGCNGGWDYRAGKNIKGCRGFVIFAAARLGVLKSLCVAACNAPRIVTPVRDCARLRELAAWYSSGRHPPTPSDGVFRAAAAATAARGICCCTHLFIKRIRGRPKEGAGPHKRLNKKQQAPSASWSDATEAMFSASQTQSRYREMPCRGTSPASGRPSQPVRRAKE
jgi:hypothetical protein